MDGGMLVRIEGLRKSFPRPDGEVTVLRGIDLEIERGESVAIMGESGAGKSTLLHIAGALEPPSGGSVLIDGVDLWGLPSKKLAGFRNTNLGFVFQFHHLLPEFSAVENAMMPGLIARLSESEARERASSVLSDLGLSHRLGHKVGELSGGEQQRVAIARAVLLEPMLILADEPTGNLDAATGESVEDVLLGLNRDKGITLFVVTHSGRLARKMDRMIGLSDGLVTAEAVV